jgi:hypothetical protein
LSVFVICDIERIACPPIWTAELHQEIDLTVTLKEALQKNRTWVKTVQNECADAKKLLQQMQKSKKSYLESQDSISRMQKYFAEISKFSTNVKNAIEGADDDTSTGYEQNSKKRLLKEIEQILEDKNKLEVAFRQFKW